ncbi:MAG: hypothetical protein WDO24_10560 [Pseudomonadota bacterium]
MRRFDRSGRSDHHTRGETDDEITLGELRLRRRAVGRRRRIGCRPAHYSLGYDQPRTTGYGIAADIFAKKLEELSKGAILIDQFPARSSARSRRCCSPIRTGDIDFMISSSANASTVAPESGVFSLHFIFRGEDHLERALHDPALIAEMKAMVGDSVKGRAHPHLDDARVCATCTASASSTRSRT